MKFHSSRTCTHAYAVSCYSFVAVATVFVLAFSILPNALFAAVNTTQATGGLQILASTAGGAFTGLTGPIIEESNDSEIGDGTIILTAPAGFEFDTGASTVVRIDCTSSCGGGGDNANNINGLPDNATIAAIITSTTITITITDDTDNGNENTLTWQNVRVRPTAAFPLATGNITRSGTSVITGGSVNMGTLVEVGGVCNGLTATTYIDGSVIRGGSMDGLTYNGVLVGTSASDVIVGTSGADYIDGQNGNDTICGGGGDDIINGGEGSDSIYGEAGNDSIYGGNGTDTLSGGNNNDIIYGGLLADTCSGDTGSDDVGGCGPANEGTAVGAVIVAKNALPDSTQDFTFTGTWSFTLDDDANVTLPNTWMAAATVGTKTVTESSVTGWSLTGLSCTGGGGDTSTDVNTRTATVGLDADEEVTCAFTNTQHGTLTVTKVVVNDNGGTSASGSFPLFINGNATINAVAQTLTPGTYTVSETSDPLYAATFSGDCSSTGAVVLGSGENKTCIITNNDIAPTLTVTKVVVNDDGGTAESGSFVLRVDGSPVLNQVQNSLNAGTVTVSEDTVYGYTGSITGDCASNGSLTMVIGGVYHCTITNDDIAPKLTVTKVVVNDNGAAKIVSDFPLYIDGNLVTSAAVNTVIVGAHVVSEDVDTQYANVITGDCDADGNITLGIGDNKTCIITNDDKPGTVVVTKQVVNDHGGTSVASSFTISIAGNNASVSNFPGDGSGTSITVDTGNYSVFESSHAGYSVSYSSECSGTILPGELKTCTVTNNDIQPVLTVIKVVTNDNGGTLDPDDFTLTLSGTNLSQSSVLGSAVGVDVTLNAGSFAVTEAATTGYAATFSADCSGAIAVGETKTCTVTNDDIAPKLTVTKLVDNNHGGTSIPADFPLFIDGNPITNGVQFDSTVGSHTISETTSSAYDDTFSGDCDANGVVILAIGDVKSCVLTNSDLPGTLVVIEEVINDNGGTFAASNFTITATGAELTPVSFAGNALGSTLTADAGSYEVTPVPVIGYAITLSPECVGSILPGQTITCIIVSNDLPGFFDQVTGSEGRTQQNGGTSGHGTNRYTAIVQHYLVQFGSFPPGSFGGSSAIPLSNAEVDFICTMKASLTWDATPGLIDWLIAYIADSIGRDVSVVHDAFMSETVCTGGPQTQAFAPAPKPVAVHVTREGVVVSTNSLWNACVTGQGITLELIRSNPDTVTHRQGRIAKVFQKTCRDYHPGSDNVWLHPDFTNLWMTLDTKGRIVGGLPIGYLAVRESALKVVSK